MSPRCVAPRRRDVLAGIGAAGLGGVAGCVDGLFSRLSRSGPDQVSLTVTTVPADDDAGATTIGRQLVDNMRRAGIDAGIEIRDQDQLLESVLLEHDFDIFIAKHPGIDDPDALRTLLHSAFLEETGWQNPFGFSNDTVNDLLEEQRSPDERDRAAVVADLQERLFDLQPFSVVAYPDFLSAARTELNYSRTPGGITEPLDYLRLGHTNPDLDRLRVGLLDSSVTVNRNPLAVEFRTDDTVVDLLYEPIARWIDGLRPWLAREIEWEQNDHRLEARIRLREGLQWHDGQPLEASDVAFTYRFLADTTLGADNGTVPAPRFRDRVSLVENVVVESERSVTVRFETTHEEVAQRALMVPVLPEHEWEVRTDDVQEYLTEALIWDNEPSIGSGPYRFVDAAEDGYVLLERYDEHFLRSIGPDDPLDGLEIAPSFDEIEFSVFPNSGAAINAIEDDDIELIASPLPTKNASTVNRSSDASLLVGTRGTFYLIGFNYRRGHPITDHRFRTVVARLIDRAHLVAEALGGYGSPSDSVLNQTAYMQTEFAWAGDSALGEFPGEDGDVDEDAARELFDEQGFRYNDNGELVTQT